MKGPLATICCCGEIRIDRMFLPKRLSTETKNKPEDLLNERKWNLFFLPHVNLRHTKSWKERIFLYWKYLIDLDLKHDPQLRHITSKKYNLIPTNAVFCGKVRLMSEKLPLILEGWRHQTCSSLRPHLIPKRMAKLIFFLSFFFFYL